MVINKPAGLAVHADGRTAEPTVSEWFVKKYPEAKDVGEPIRTSLGFQPPSPSPRRGAGGEVVIERPGIVHRLDRETSGALILAKTKAGYECLKKQFQNREIEKIYHAFLHGKLKEGHGTINLKIERSKSDFRKRLALRSLGGARGREAITYYKVLKQTPEVAFVEAKPKTGRTHQIRVHFKALHHPILGDKLYAPKLPKLLGFERLALHAREIAFKDVLGGQHRVLANYPEDFKRALDNVGYSDI